MPTHNMAGSSPLACFISSPGSHGAQLVYREGHHTEAWESREGQLPSLALPPSHPCTSARPVLSWSVGTRLRLAEEIRTKEKERCPGPAHALSI